MGENRPIYTWTGRDGTRYVLSEVSDNHVLFYFRMLQERLLRDGSRLPQLIRRRLERDIITVLEELDHRRLDPLPVRSIEDQQQAQEIHRQRYGQPSPPVSPPTSPPPTPQDHPLVSYQTLVNRQRKPDPPPPKPSSVPVVTPTTTGRKIFIRKKPN